MTERCFRRGEGKPMEGRSKDPPVQVISQTLSSNGESASSNVVGSNGLSSTPLNPLQKYALPSSRASWSGRLQEREREEEEKMYQTSPTVFRSSPSPQKRSPGRHTQNVDHIRAIVLAVVQDIMQSKAEAGEQKAALEHRIMRTAVAQSETNTSLQALRLRIEELPARDLGVLHQARKLEQAFQKCDKECQVWRHRLVEAEKAANNYAAVAAEAKQAMQHKETALSNEKEEATAKMLAKSREVVEAQNDARVLAKYCEEYMAKEEDLMRSLENAKAETRAALTEVFVSLLILF